MPQAHQHDPRSNGHDEQPNPQQGFLAAIDSLERYIRATREVQEKIRPEFLVSCEGRLSAGMLPPFSILVLRRALAPNTPREVCADLFKLLHRTMHEIYKPCGEDYRLRVRTADFTKRFEEELRWCAGDKPRFSEGSDVFKILKLFYARARIHNPSLPTFDTVWNETPVRSPVPATIAQQHSQPT